MTPRDGGAGAATPATDHSPGTARRSTLGDLWAEDEAEDLALAESAVAGARAALADYDAGRTTLSDTLGALGAAGSLADRSVLRRGWSWRNRRQVPSVAPTVVAFGPPATGWSVVYEPCGERQSIACWAQVQDGSGDLSVVALCDRGRGALEPPTPCGDGYLRYQREGDRRCRCEVPRFGAALDDIALDDLKWCTRCRGEVES